MILIKDNKKYNVKNCTKFKDRLVGLSFKRKINEILCFPKCNSIHTFFMFNSIDVVMCDKDLNILYIYKNLKPNKIIFPKKNVYYTFEFKENLINFKQNEKLDIKI